MDNTVERNTILKVWHEHAKSKFDVRKGYLVVSVRSVVSPVTMRPPSIGDVAEETVRLAFRMTFDDSDYVIRCRGVEVDRGPVSDILRASYGAGTR